MLTRMFSSGELFILPVNTVVIPPQIVHLTQCSHHFPFSILTDQTVYFVKGYFQLLGFPDSSVGKESACNAGDPSLIPGLGRFAGEVTGYPLQYSWVSLVAQLVKKSTAIWETWIWSLGWEDPLDEGKGYPLQCSGLEKSMDSIVHGVAKSKTWLSDFHFTTVLNKEVPFKGERRHTIFTLKVKI